ncbi:restriction endonuclease subunit S [Mycobacterium avium subsp. hominissuis]|uniref:restriction endonuclease subunit S n=1 Tax=Mycobacteriaceae TaxID=1762 RepID=UPI0007EC28B3|nr:MULTISPECIES: restriction endonuclease subunit S [Mycobacteriaceae]NOQ58484.1 restriction endonuclease subunit S [Mycolicibacterium fortuitum]OBB40672.1 restriction endonuclease subunit S [Mycolicibacterium fortuitum]OBB76510.1 restriction endonuclease subunit S [Mycolicibacterium fortuitum]OBF82255.1 restriction endonuclease subunit S [Mycolicibacterium fortuitum]OBG16968.1 restriction endonuclease subunit S [Mycolicibacterium fortuitum]
MTTQGAWPIRPFAEIADYGVGKTPARANADYWAQSDQNVPWVSISDLAPYGLVTKTKETVSRKAFDEVFRAKLVPAGTLLMSFKLTIGRIATLGVPAAHNEAIISIYPRPGVHQRFLGYFLSQYDYADLQDRQIKGNTLNKSKIDRIPVPVPPEGEQRRVADLLDGLRHAIDLQDAVLVNLAQMKSAAMRHLFTRGLRQETQKETELDLIPASWEVATIDKHFTVVSGGTPSRSNAAYWAGGTVPWVKTTEVNYSVITETEEHITRAGLDGSAAKMLQPGTLLMAMYGQGVTRGKVALLGIEASCNQACAAMTPTDDEVVPRYLYHYLTSRYEAIRSLAHGGQQQNLNLDIVRKIGIAVPPTIEEQQEIVEILDALDSKTALHRHKRAVLDRLFKSLLHKLMTGEISVDDLDLSSLPSIDGTAA